jgi:hypothetical protein
LSNYKLSQVYLGEALFGSEIILFARNFYGLSPMLSNKEVTAEQIAETIEELRKEAENLKIRYEVDAQSVYFDARDFDSHPDFYTGLDPKPDGVVLAFGLLADQQESQKNFELARSVTETNYTGAISILEIVAADFESRGN